MQDFILYFSQNPTALYLAVGLLVSVLVAFKRCHLPHPKMMEQEWRTDCQLFCIQISPLLMKAKLL